MNYTDSVGLECYPTGQRDFYLRGFLTGSPSIFMMKRICQICKKEYEIIRPCRLKNSKFCSNKCYGKWRSKYMVGEKHPRWKTIERFCLICKKKFYLPFCRIRKEGNFCSNKCVGIWQSGLRGSLARNWKGGVSQDYEKHFTEREWDKIRKQCYKRDNHYCQICGKTKVMLHAHHVIPWRISHDDSLSNLLTVCKKCHNYAEHKWTLFSQSLLKR